MASLSCVLTDLLASWGQQKQANNADILSPQKVVVANLLSSFLINTSSRCGATLVLI